MCSNFINSSFLSITQHSVGVKMTETETVELASFQMKKPLLFTGFTGPGLIGPSVLTYIAEQLEMKQVAYVKSSLFPPITRIIKRVPQHPIRIYADNKKNILLMISDIFVQNEYTNTICSHIFEWIKKQDIPEIIAINGMPFMDVPNVKHIILGYSTGNTKYLPQTGIRPLVDGVITGMDSSILHKCLESNILWTCLMTTTKELSGLDPSAVIKSLETVNHVFNFNVNVGKLKKEFQKIQALRKEGLMGSRKNKLS